MLIIHGEENQRAPIGHANSLMKALDKANIPYEKIIKDKEGHGVYKEEHIVEANSVIIDFLNCNIRSQ